ncbi:hypothetical protein [Nonomuraea sp. NPDC002799]
MGRWQHAPPSGIEIVAALGVVTLGEGFGIRQDSRHWTDAIREYVNPGLDAATIAALNGLPHFC